MLWCTVSEPQAFIIGRASSVTFTAFREVSHLHALFLFFFFSFPKSVHCLPHHSAVVVITTYLLSLSQH